MAEPCQRCGENPRRKTVWMKDNETGRERQWEICLPCADQVTLTLDDVDL